MSKTIRAVICLTLLAAPLSGAVSAYALNTNVIELSGALDLNDNSPQSVDFPFEAVTASEIGDFPGSPAPGSTGIIRDIALTAPGPRNVPGFITFQQPSTQFNLDFIEPGVFGSALCPRSVLSVAGQNCTPPNSFLNFTNLGHGSTLSFEVKGHFVDNATGETIEQTVNAPATHAATMSRHATRELA